METNNIKNLERESVHFISAHSYVLYFVLLLVGISLDLIFKLTIFNNAVMIPIGIFLLVFSTILIFWTEHTTRHFPKEVSVEAFCRGPYCYTRSPIHWGLFFLMLGFGIVINAFFVILSTVVSFLIGKFLFQSKSEKILERKYGTHYREYKKLVRF